MGCSVSHSCQVDQMHPRDFHANFVLGEKIGQGAYGQVHAVREVSAKSQKSEDASRKAVKILCLENGDPEATQKLQENAIREIKIWEKIGIHPNCVRLHDRFVNGHFCFIVMERLDCGLFQGLNAMEDINERNLGNFFAQMLEAIAHCHSVNVVHRDIKCDNFLLDGQTVKLVDFGLSAVLPISGVLPGIHGTAPFMCPEMLRKKEYNTKADVWSFGVIAYTLTFGQFPYMPLQRDAKDMKKIISRGTPSPSFTVILPAVAEEYADNITCRSSIAISFVKALLTREPEERPSADEALDMPWMLAARRGNHLLEEDLPSLRPMLHAAQMSGAFEARDLNSVSQIDLALNASQMERRSVSTPTTVFSNILKLRTRPEELERGLSNHSTNSGGSNVIQYSSSGSSLDRRTTAQIEWCKPSSVRSL